MRSVHWVLGLGVACGGLLGVFGCAEDNEKLVPTTGESKSVAAPGTTTDPEEMYRKQMLEAKTKKWPSNYPGAKRNKKA